MIVFLYLQKYILPWGIRAKDKMLNVEFCHMFMEITDVILRNCQVHYMSYCSWSLLWSLFVETPKAEVLNSILSAAYSVSVMPGLWWNIHENETCMQSQSFMNVCMHIVIQVKLFSIPTALKWNQCNFELILVINVLARPM